MSQSLQNIAGSDLVGQREQRIQKIAQMNTLGINPFPSKSTRDALSNQIHENFSDYEGKRVVVAGRIMAWREHGEIIFADIQDKGGIIQLYIHRENLKPTSKESQTIGAEHLTLFDIGDFIEAKGNVGKTQSGEISIMPEELRILTKSIRPLPNKWKGIEDKETRYRRRYLDMTMNTDIRARFERRAKFWEEVRSFLNKDGFYEVNIPVLEHTTGGADAKPFVTHYDSLGEDLYLRISHELPLKRLIGAGFEKVYDLGPRFRNEGFSDEHLPEHIAMEWYWAYADYRDGMRLTEDMFKTVLNNVYGTLKFEVKGHDIDLSKPWEVIDFTTVIREKLGVDIFNDTLESMKNVLLKHNPEAGNIPMNRSRISDSLWKVIRKNLSGPAFLVGVPKFLSPLAKSSLDNVELTDRFHPIIAGSEMANAFSELNDPIDQLERFVEQENLREAGDDEAQMMDIDFVEMLEYGMPPTVGFGMSERVFWAFENISAREGVPFPPLKRGFDNTTKKLYSDVFDFDAYEKSHKESENKAAKRQGVNGDQDLGKKFVLILSNELEGWRLTNTVGHLSAYLGSKVGTSLTSRDIFSTADQKDIPANSQYPIIALSAKPGQLFNLLEKVEQDSDIEYLAYTQEMIDINLDEELQKRFSEINKSDATYLGIGIFGPKEKIDALTKKFSLWR